MSSSADPEAEPVRTPKKRKTRHGFQESCGSPGIVKREGGSPQDPIRFPVTPSPTPDSGQRKSKKRKKRKEPKIQDTSPVSLKRQFSVASVVSSGTPGRPRLGFSAPVGLEIGYRPTMESGLEEGDCDKLPDYKYADLPPNSIRILIIHPGEKTSELECSLSVTPLPLRRQHEEEGVVRSENHEEPRGWDALSYVWGEKPESVSIRMRTEGDPAQLKITPSLFSALSGLRDRKHRRFFWVDAICINQPNALEKNHQVPLMAKIYHEARNVRVWLGESSEDSPAALALIRKLLYLRQYNRVVETTSCEEWKALAELMKRPWFSRRWVVQEIALARQATLHCGEYHIPWPEFADAVELFKELEPQVREKFRASTQHKNQHNYLGDVWALSASQLVVAVRDLVRKANDMRILTKLSTLEALVSRLTPFEAGSPHDIIYAVLSLANDVPGFKTPANVAVAPDESSVAVDLIKYDEKQLRILERAVGNLRVTRYPIDYSAPFYNVARDFMDFVTKKSESLDMICRPWVPESACQKLPTWLRSLKYRTHGSRSDGSRIRINGDTLVGQPGERTYSASGDYPTAWEFSKDDKVRSLTVKGFRLDEVLKVKDPAPNGIIPNSWPEFVGWTDFKTDPPEEFWRTLVADRTAEKGECPLYYARACQAVFLEKVEGGNVVTSDITTTIDSELMESVMERLRSVVWGRRLIRTKGQQLLGLAPSEPRATKKHDLVCILLGCTVPVILRERGHNPETGKPFYRLMGECYIHGMMDGDAFKIKNKEGIKYETFEIR
jgi:Heterokaryon incompatibility protein (HET)